jgi:glycosyltransferase involved in cell wall biosynthesis
VMTREQAHGEIIRAAGIRLLPMNFSRGSLNPVSEFISLVKIWFACRRERADVLHHVGVKAIFYGSLAALMSRRRPAIVNAPVGMGYVFSSGQLMARLLRPGFRLAYRLLLNPPRSQVIFENPDDAAWFVDNGVVRPADATVIRGAGIDIAKFQPVPAAPDGPPVVALVARMLRDKGVCEFVEAAHRLHDAGIAARFVLVGDPDPENRGSIPVEQLRSWHGRKGIEWWGWRKDMAAVWREVHIACLPSWREGLPKALLEAAACGLPIITTDAIGCREVVRNGDNGLLVPVGDAPALAKALRTLISDGELRSRMGKQSRAMAEREFSSERVIRETLGVYRSLADNRKVSAT